MFNLWASSCGLKVWLATRVLPISEEQTGQNKEATRRKCTSVEMIGELKHKLKSMLERFLFLVSFGKSVWLCSHWPCLILLLLLLLLFLPCTKQKCVFLGFDSTKSIQHMVVCILRKAIYSFTIFNVLEAHNKQRPSILSLTLSWSLVHKTWENLGFYCWQLQLPGANLIIKYMHRTTGLGFLEVLTMWVGVLINARVVMKSCSI